MSIPELLDRLKTRKPKAAGPRPPEGEDLAAARRFLAAVARYEQARIARKGPLGAAKAAAGALADAERRLAHVVDRDADFFFMDAQDLDVPNPKSARRVRHEQVVAQAEAEVDRARGSVFAAESALADAESALALELRGAQEIEGAAVCAERLLASRAHDSARVLAGAESARVAADRALHEACTAASAGAPRPQGLQARLAVASGGSPTTAEITRARESLAEAAACRDAAAAEVGRIQEEAVVFRRTLDAVLDARRAAREREKERDER
jgi:hypothetical protein